MKQTPIQKLKGLIHDMLIAAEDVDQPNYFIKCRSMEIVDQLLEEEKELVQEAFEHGWDDGYDRYDKDFCYKRYFNQTFNTKEK